MAEDDGEDRMDRLTGERSGKAGQAPGSLEYLGDADAHDIEIRVIDYGPDEAEETTVADADAAAEYLATDTVTWIDITGVHDPAVIQDVGGRFDLHPLVLEDIVTPDQRPKVEEYEDYIFVVLQMLQYDEATDSVSGEQVSLVLTEHAVISFQERPTDVFDPVRKRITRGKGRVREGGPDYLLYALIDAVVDNYFYVLEQLGDDLEVLEDAVVQDPEHAMLEDLNDVKQELIYVRKAVWPLREAVSRLERTESGLIDAETRPYLRDVYDHAVQVIDVIESLRDVQSGTLDIYLSSVSNRMNEVMKVLTIIGSIFIPLTFIAGVYGMNFRYMPELAHPAGYPAVLLLMAAIGVGLTAYFKHRDWL